MTPEQDAFIETLYHSNFKTLTLYATSILPDSARAQDVVQDTFHEAVLHIGTLMAHENPGGWLMATLKYKIKESERARQRYIHRFFSLDAAAAAELIPAGGLTGGPQEPDFVMEAIRQALTPEEYKLLTRLTLDKASHLEVAREFGISVYACQKRLERIRGKLYRQFPERKKKN